MLRISILADFRPGGVSFHAAVVFGLDKDILFKYTLGHCDVTAKSSC